MRGKLAACTLAIGLTAGLASAAPAARAATPHVAVQGLTAQQSVGTFSPRGKTPNAKTGLGGLCLSLLQFTPGSATWLEPCNPAEDAAQTWVLTVLYGSVESWSLLAHPDICIGGVPGYDDFATTYDCAEPTPEDVRQGIALYGGTRGGTNWFRNHAKEWLVSHNTEGRVTWERGTRTLLDILLRRGPNAGWIANDGWDDITIDSITHPVADAIHAQPPFGIPQICNNMDLCASMAPNHRPLGAPVVAKRPGNPYNVNSVIWLHEACGAGVVTSTCPFSRATWIGRSFLGAHIVKLEGGAQANGLCIGVNPDAFSAVYSLCPAINGIGGQGSEWVITGWPMDKAPYKLINVTGTLVRSTPAYLCTILPGTSLWLGLVAFRKSCQWYPFEPAQLI